MPHIKQTHMYTTQLLRDFSFAQDSLPVLEGLGF